MASAHSLDPTATLWAFVAGGQEARFLADIIFATHVLKRRGVPTANVIVFVDHPQAAVHFSPYGTVGKLFPTCDFDKVLRGAGNHRHVVVAVTGHGSPAGIATAIGDICPTSLLATVRGCPGIEAAVIVLCQCFAGVFNYLDVRAAAANVPPVVLVGATGLHNSLSSSVDLLSPIPRLDGQPGQKTWNANLFMLGFFEWVLTRRDVDGDGRPTVLDAYRHAGVASSQLLTNAKSRLYVEAADLSVRIRSLGREASKIERNLQRGRDVIKELVPESIARFVKDRAPGLAAALTKSVDIGLRDAANQQTAKHRLEMQALDVSLTKNLECLHCHQDPWILHVELAREIEV